MATSSVVKPKSDEPEHLPLDAALLPISEYISMDKTLNKIHESVTFIWYDPQQKSGLNLIGLLRSINDCAQLYTEKITCLNKIQGIKGKIFFITSTDDNEIIAEIHSFNHVEGIFILNSNIESIRGNFPKLFGIFRQQEDLLRVLKEILDLFEQIQLEEFAFESDKSFLWNQLWKQDITSKKSMKRNVFIEASRQYYRDNIIIHYLIDELDKSYRSVDIINWCFRSPFPTRFLHHALRSRDTKLLSVCRPLFIDASRYFQQRSQSKLSEQFYRAMKLSNELLDKFVTHVGQLVCTSGFFPCMRSRTNALLLVSRANYRPDLSPVLFKIDCDPSAPYTELNNRNLASLIVFDMCIAFKVVYVNRDSITVIKLKTAIDCGKKIALDYLEQHKTETIESILADLLKPAQPVPNNDYLEKVAQSYVKNGEIDKALTIYQSIQPTSAWLLNTMGRLYAEEKNDFKSALQCHKQALKLQEETNEDTADTLTDLGNAHQNCNEYPFALDCHRRAVKLRQSHRSPDRLAIASNYIGIANAHWANGEYAQAIDNTKEALIIRENFIPRNQTSIAATLALLSYIYQDFGDNQLALSYSQKALGIFERRLSNDSPVLAELLVNMGAMQSSVGLLNDARHTLKRVVQIYRKILPEEHPDRLDAESEFEKVNQLLKPKNKNSHIHKF